MTRCLRQPGCGTVACTCAHRSFVSNPPRHNQTQATAGCFLPGVLSAPVARCHCHPAPAGSTASGCATWSNVEATRPRAMKVKWNADVAFTIRARTDSTLASGRLHRGRANFFHRERDEQAAAGRQGATEGCSEATRRHRAHSWVMRSSTPGSQTRTATPRPSRAVRASRRLQLRRRRERRARLHGPQCLSSFD